MKKPRTRTSPRPRFNLEPLEPRLLMAAQSLTFTDADTTVVKVTLTGNGTLALVPSDNGSFNDVVITGSDQGTRLSFSTKGGDKRASVNDIVVTGAMNSISGIAIDILGDITFTGSVRTVTVGNLPAGQAHHLTIGGTSAAKTAKITLGSVVDLLLQSGTPLASLKVADWQDTDDNDLVQAPLLKKLTSAADLKTSLHLQNTVEGAGTLGPVTVKGVLDGTWFVDGAASGVTAGSVDPTFSMNTRGKLTKISAKTTLSGVWAATAIGTVKAGTDLTGATILAGAELGDDAKLGGTGADTDLFFRGTLGSVSVRGGMVNSVLGAGLDPVNGVFGDSDDFVTGKNRSTMGSVHVAGTSDTQSRIAAGKFSTISIGGTRIDPPGDPRILLPAAEPDETPPVIVAELRADTGTPDDGVTGDATIEGRVTDLGQITQFSVGVDIDVNSDNPKQFVSILSLLKPNGTFELLRSKIEQINGGPLSLGLHTISFSAKDDANNLSQFFNVTFTLTP
jgi:hypothetical protein